MEKDILFLEDKGNKLLLFQNARKSFMGLVDCPFKAAKKLIDEISNYK